jgi:hypothetical protein
MTAILTALNTAKYHGRKSTVALLLSRGGASVPFGKERMTDAYTGACEQANAVKLGHKSNGDKKL